MTRIRALHNQQCTERHEHENFKRFRYNHDCKSILLVQLCLGTGTSSSTVLYVVFDSCEGCTQGDSLGPFYFTVGYHMALLVPPKWRTRTPQS